MSESISSLILMASATVATIAAYMAHRAVERDVAKAEAAIRLASAALAELDAALAELSAAIASIRSSRVSRRSLDSATSLDSSASAQSSTSFLRRECGVDPCRSVVATSSLAAAGPILDSRATSSGGSGMVSPETPNVRAEAGPTAKRQARVVENAPAHCAGLAF